MIRFRTAALGLALSVGAASLAAAQSTTGTSPHASAGARADRAERGRDRRLGRGLFKGIDLTAEQRQRIRQVHESYRTQWQQLRDQIRPAMQEARAARQRGDTAAAKAAWDRTADARRQAQALREKETADVRAVLTPEQQRQFDTNVAVLKQKLEQRRERGRAHRS